MKDENGYDEETNSYPDAKHYKVLIFADKTAGEDAGQDPAEGLTDSIFQKVYEATNMPEKYSRTKTDRHTIPIWYLVEHIDGPETADEFLTLLFKPEGGVDDCGKLESVLNFVRVG